MTAICRTSAPRLIVAALAIVLCDPAGSASAAASAPSAPYSVVVPTWPIDVVGDAHTAAGTIERSYLSWNGSRLTYTRFDFPSESTVEEPAVTAVNAAGSVVGVDSSTDPASTSGIPASTSYTAFGMSDGKPIAALSNESNATAINDSGTIVGAGAYGFGFALDTNEKAHAFFALAPGSWGRSVVPGAINARGDVAGTSTVTHAMGNRFGSPPTPVHIFVIRGIATSDAARDLGVVPSCPSPVVTGIDDRDRIVGNCQSTPARGWIWEAGAYRKLKPLPGDAADRIAGVTANGIVAGSSSSHSRERAVLWRDGNPVLLSALSSSGAGRLLKAVVSVSADGWFLVKSGSDNVLVVPSPDVGAAQLVAKLPPLPQDTPGHTDQSYPSPAPTPLPDHTFTPAAPDAVRSDAPPSLTQVRWSVPVDALVTDGTNSFAVRGNNVLALEKSGAIRWKHVVGAGATIDLSGEYVIASTPKSFTVLSKTTGTVRWSRAAAIAERVDGSTITVADGHSIRRYALATGAQLRTLQAPRSCADKALLSSAAFGCLGNGLNIYDVTTGRPIGAFAGIRENQTTNPAPGENFYVSLDDSLLAIHPASGTFDSLYVSGAEGAKYTVIGSNAVAVSQQYIVRFPVDRDPMTNPIVRLPNETDYNGQVRVTADAVYRRTPNRGLVITKFDATGAPRDTTFPALTAFPDADMLVAGSHVFLATDSNVFVVDATAGRIVANLKLTCQNFSGGAVSGTRVILGCTGDTTRAVGFDLQPVRVFEGCAVPAGGPVYARSRDGGLLAIRYDAAGKPSADAEPDPDAEGEGDRPLSVGGGFVFLNTPAGIDVVAVAQKTGRAREAAVRFTRFRADRNK